MKLVIDMRDADADAEDMLMMMQVVEKQIAEGFTSGKIGDMAWDLQEADA